jgi:hypothetical protein
MVEVLVGKRKPYSICKVFVFRCEWFDVKGNPDGYTYSRHRHLLLKEVFRREMATGCKASQDEVVPVDDRILGILDGQKNGVFNTVLNVHVYDLKKSKQS